MMLDNSNRTRELSVNIAIPNTNYDWFWSLSDTSDIAVDDLEAIFEAPLPFLCTVNQVLRIAKHAELQNVLSNAQLVIALAMAARFKVQDCLVDAFSTFLGSEFRITSYPHTECDYVLILLASLCTGQVDTIISTLSDQNITACQKATIIAVALHAVRVGTLCLEDYEQVILAGLAVIQSEYSAPMWQTIISCWEALPLPNVGQRMQELDELQGAIWNDVRSEQIFTDQLKYWQTGERLTTKRTIDIIFEVLAWLRIQM